MIDNQTAHERISAAFTDFKGYNTSRSERMKFADDLIEEYFAAHGEQPAGSVLDRLGTLILQDELADRDRMKMRKNEYPIMSDNQEKYRNKGKRSLNLADEVAVDGANYRIKTRDSNRIMRCNYGL